MLKGDYMQNMPQGISRQDVTPKMSEDEKLNFIYSHWAEYETYTKQHCGKPFGFPFPDGSCVERDKDDEYFESRQKQKR